MSDFQLDTRAAHLAVDMQRLFAEPGPWHVPWLERILPNVAALAERHPERTVFTRFIPPREAGLMPGAWRDYYRHWQAITRSNLDPRLLELVEPLDRLAAQAHVCDKAVYSAFGNPGLRVWLARRGIETLIVSGGETDVCVLATVMSALDFGFRIILVSDALCSTSDTTHDALMLLYRRRYSLQVGTATTEEILATWE